MKIKRLYIIQTLILLGGTIFAWWTVYHDFDRFALYEGTIFKIQDCAIPNPVTTPCFYGAFAFLIALIWSWILMDKQDDARRKHQRRLRWLLIASVLFAWSNLGLEVYRWAVAGGEEHVGCSGALVTNPLATPCFIGSAFFLLALIVGLIVVRRDRVPSSS